MCLICGIWDSHVSMSGDSLFFFPLMAFTIFGAQDVMHWWDGICHADPRVSGIHWGHARTWVLIYRNKQTNIGRRRRSKLGCFLLLFWVEK
jgi:hypothetical protein